MSIVSKLPEIIAKRGILTRHLRTRLSRCPKVSRRQGHALYAAL